MPYYVFNDANCKFEGMTKEEILTAIAQAVATHEIHDVDTGFVTTIKERNADSALKIWRGTQAEYNAIATPDPDTFYIITDDDTVEQLQTDMATLESTVSGDISSLQGEVDALETRAGALESRATTDEGNITALQNRMTTAESNIAHRGASLWTGAVSGSGMKGAGDTITFDSSGYNAFAIKIISPALQKRIMLFAGFVNIPTVGDVLTVSGSNGFYDGNMSKPAHGYISFYHAESDASNLFHITRCCFIGKNNADEDLEFPAYVYEIFGIF